MALSSSAAVLPSDRDVRLLLLGDAGVGKSFLIEAFLTARVPAAAEVPAMHEEYAINEDIDGRQLRASGHARIRNRRVLVDSDGGTLGADASAVRLVVQQKRPDVVLLCYSIGSPESMRRLATHWLPALSSSGYVPQGWDFLPVMLVGLQADRLTEDTPSIGGIAGRRALWQAEYARVWTAAAEAWEAAEQGRARISGDLPEPSEAVLPPREAVEAVRWHLSMAGGAAPEEAAHGFTEEETVRALHQACLHSLLMGFRAAVASISVSAAAPTAPDGLLAEISEVWTRGAEAALYPTFPLFDTIRSDFTPAAERALARIFRIADSDCDGALSVDEFLALQAEAHGVRITEDEVVATFSMVKAELDAASGGAAEEGEEGGAAAASAPRLRLEGFKHIVACYVLSQSTDMAWHLLHAFGYRCELKAPQVAGPAPSAGAALPLWSLQLLYPSRELEGLALSARAFAGAVDSCRPVCLWAACSRGCPSLKLHSLVGSAEAAFEQGSLEKQLGMDPSAPRLPNLLYIAEHEDAEGALRALRGLGAGNEKASEPLAGVRAVARLFMRGLLEQGWDQDSREPPLLTPLGLEALFSVTPQGAHHPLLARVQGSVPLSEAGALSLPAWVAFWQMLAATEPHTAAAALYELGALERMFPAQRERRTLEGKSERPDGAPRGYDWRPRVLLREELELPTAEERHRRAAGALQTVGEPLPAPAPRSLPPFTAEAVRAAAGAHRTVRRVLVMGGGVCRTDLFVQQRLRGAHAEGHRGGADAARRGGDAAAAGEGPAQHYALPADFCEDLPPAAGRVGGTQWGGAFSERAHPSAWAALNALRPASLLVTEWSSAPEDFAAGASLLASGAVDTMLLLVAPEDTTSVAYALLALESVPRGVPVLIVRDAVSAAAAAADGSSAAATEWLNAICSEDGPWRLTEAVAGALSDLWRRSGLAREGPAGGEDGRIPAPPFLQVYPPPAGERRPADSDVVLQCYRMPLVPLVWKKPADAEAAFQLATYLSLQPGLLNPVNAEARAAARREAQWRVVRTAALVVTAAALVGGAVALATDAGSARSKLRSSVARVSAGVRGVWEGAMSALRGPAGAAGGGGGAEFTLSSPLL